MNHLIWFWSYIVKKNSGLMIMMQSENILLYIQELLFLGSEVKNC